MVSRSNAVSAPTSSWSRALLILGIGGLLATLTVQTWLGQASFATSFLSPATYHSWMNTWGVPAETVGDVVLYAVPWTLAVILTCGGLILGLGCAGLLAALACRGRLSREALIAATARVGWGAGVLGLWTCVWLPMVLVAGESGAAIMAGVVPFWAAVAIAVGLSRETRVQSPAHELSVPQPSTLNSRLLIAIALYTLVFTTLNWRLWFNLLLPHGDSAMYEEHLWNVLHGKGFRSYLDQGLFLGEHIQFVHLGLIPLYLLWPSHLLLELCESLALACGALPVAWMTLRHTQSRSAALAAAAAYLLYTPMQFLDIEIDLKTFRPEAFGIPLLLLTLDQLDRGRWRGFLLGVLACLTVKEDYAIILSPLGLWIAGTAWYRSRATRETTSDVPSSHLVRGTCWLVMGLGLCLFGVVYLWLATRVVMPWFRPGQDIHYASYFSRLGESPEAIVKTILTRPGFVAGEVLTISTLLYALALLVPVGGIALLSPGRLAVGLPLFGILCLNELARDPRHQFHAPLVAIVCWATAAGMGNVPQVWIWCRDRWSAWRGSTLQPSHSPSPQEILNSGSRWLWTCSLATGLMFSLGPLGLPFWDPGSNWYWGRLYGSSPRGAAFAQIETLIPVTARVASTDFVHPRFTHHERSYDYSDYRRKVSGYERQVPEDTEYIVIDTTHPYSEYHVAEDVPEFQEKDRWELLTTEPDAVFLVFKRR